MPLKLTTVSLRTAIADVRRLEDESAVLLLEIWAGLIAGLATSTTALTELFDTGLTDILFMGASLLMQTGIE